MLKVIKEIPALQKISDYYRKTGKTIGLVPTMGFLHEGHTALISKARRECDIVIISIYVNPTQFLPGEDFNKYPRNFLRDFEICKEFGADYILSPENGEMYKENFITYISPKGLSEKLEGIFRPGHFDGVATIVLKLFNITKPHFTYFGQKDAQQAIIIKRLIKDLNLDINMKICETVRENNGLAKSSRNMYLSESEKEEASILYKTLLEGKRLIIEKKSEEGKEVTEKMRIMISENSPNAQIQYIAVTDTTNLNDIENFSIHKGEILISLAVFYRKTRLIDNILFEI